MFFSECVSQQNGLRLGKKLGQKMMQNDIKKCDKTQATTQVSTLSFKVGIYFLFSRFPFWERARRSKRSAFHLFFQESEIVIEQTKKTRSSDSNLQLWKIIFKLIFTAFVLFAKKNSSHVCNGFSNLTFFNNNSPTRLSLTYCIGVYILASTKVIFSTLGNKLCRCT